MLGALLAAGLPLLPSGPRAEARPGPPVDESAVVVPLSTDSLPSDSALTVGTLPNGMRYYIRVNETPAGRAFLWLAVNAGSIQEDDDQRGYAHFLEHMAFNGTRHFPRHELISTLQLAGMRFGADINASTSFDETIYKLEVPTDEPRPLEQALTMLQDWAGGGMLVDSAEVLAERGVVLGEARSRMADTASQAIQDSAFALLFGADSRYATRPPIGLDSLLSTATPGPLRRFYRDWYRPDLMAVVVVGDVDPAAIEREIRARFGAIPMPPNPRPRVSPRLPSNAEPVVDVYVGRVSPTITVLWKQPAPRVATKTAFRQELVEELLFTGLQQRLQRLAARPGRPFIRAGIGRQPLPTRESRVVVAELLAWPTDSLERGLAAVLTEIERVAQHGVAAPALERQKAALLRRMETAAAQQPATSSRDFVDDYVRHFLNGGGALLTAEQEVALGRDVLATITPDDLAEAARFWRSGADRIALVRFPKFAHDRTPSATGIGAIFDSVARLRVAPDGGRAVDEIPLMARLPEPGRIVRERRDDASGVIRWTLSNGATVLFKPSRNDPDELLLRAASPGGWVAMPDTLFYSPGRLVDRMMTEAAGVGALDRSTLEAQLATTMLREFEVAIGPIEESIRLAGSPKDLETLFQLLHLQFTAPKLDTAALASWRQVGSARSFSFDDQIDGLVAGHHRRLIPPARGLASLVDTATAMAVYRDRFGNAGDFTFTIVGAATVDELRPLVERYVASLPSTEERETAADLRVRPWNKLQQSTFPAFEVPKASTILVYDGRVPAAPAQYLAERRRLDALAWTLRLRFTELLREQMGGTYGASVQARTYPLPEEHYRFTIMFDAAPRRIDGMIDTALAILDAVRESGATPLELEKIAAMQRRGREEQLQSNRYWLETIERYDRLRIPFDRIVAPPTSSTAEEIRAAAVRYLPTDAYIHLTAMPRDSTSYADGASTAPDSAPLMRR